MRCAIFRLILTLFPWALFADEEIDLSKLGHSFTPYIVERDSWWALLPIFSLALVVLHLQKVRRPKQPEVPK